MKKKNKISTYIIYKKEGKKCFLCTELTLAEDNISKESYKKEESSVFYEETISIDDGNVYSTVHEVHDNGMEFKTISLLGELIFETNSIVDLAKYCVENNIYCSYKKSSEEKEITKDNYWYLYNPNFVDSIKFSDIYSSRGKQLNLVSTTSSKFSYKTLIVWLDSLDFEVLRNVL